MTCTSSRPVDPAPGVEHDRAVDPAIDRMTADERATFVRTLATMALDRALDDRKTSDLDQPPALLARRRA